MLDARGISAAPEPWGTRLACGPRGIILLATGALLLQILDLLTGIRLMLVFGIDQEQNPIARALFQTGGPLGLASVKLGVVLAAALVLVLLARAGRARLARNTLVVVALLGLLGFTSNLV
jgi:threonine/homoserine efflux transporter RhtA